MDRFLVLPFWLAGQHLGVPLDKVIRVLPALLYTPLPGAPSTVFGVVNVRGKILPVVDLAMRFAWPAAQLSNLWQPFLWLKTQQRELLVPVEAVEAAVSCTSHDFAPASHPQIPSCILKGVVRTGEGLLLIQDVEQVLSDADEEHLAAALAASANDHEIR
ncbi:chemotaxis protein CheW [Pseudomonas sp.]|uniref:chemotaxis protein CheW n=1 Tax=Pseudomonas sp. TaxID=306 RepID=UPI003C7527B1